MTHIMLDLETWGKVPGSDIRSIGACVFDPVAGWVAGNNNHTKFDAPDASAPRGKFFYVATENPVVKWPNGYDKPTYTLTRDPETVQWWNDQDINARLHAFANPVDLHDACYAFGFWLGEVMGEASNMDDSPLRLWANDPHFDVSILDAVFRAVGLPIPWHYRAPRSMKTVCDLAGITREDMAQFNHGTAHNALDDAISQAMIVCEAYKRLGLRQ